MGSWMENNEKAVQTLIEHRLLDGRADDYTAYTVYGWLNNDPLIQQKIREAFKDPSLPRDHASFARLSPREWDDIRSRILANAQARSKHA